MVGQDFLRRFQGCEVINLVPLLNERHVAQQLSLLGLWHIQFQRFDPQGKRLKKLPFRQAFGRGRHGVKLAEPSAIDSTTSGLTEMNSLKPPLLR